MKNTYVVGIVGAGNIATLHAQAMGQIRAATELGWNFIGCRNINGVNIRDVSGEELDIVHGSDGNRQTNMRPRDGGRCKDNTSAMGMTGLWHRCPERDRENSQ